MSSPTPNLIKAKFNFPQVLVAQQLSPSAETVYQVPTAHAVVIATATLCNTSAVTRTVDVHVVKSGQSITTGNRAASVKLLGASGGEPGESCPIEELVGLLLGPGDAIAAGASAASSVAIILSGSVSS